MNNAVATKDELFTAINQLNTPAEAIVFTEKVALVVFRYTEGLWVELNYCYKAAEILDRLQNVLQNMADEASHWKTCEKLAELVTKVRIMADRYRKLQSDRFRASSLELAS